MTAIISLAADVDLAGASNPPNTPNDGDILQYVAATNKWTRRASYTGNVTGNVTGTVTGNTREVVNPDVTATGSTIADAAPVLEGFTKILGANAAKGVILPAAPTPGTKVLIKNSVAAILKVWPDAAAQINAVAIAGSYSVAASAPSMFIAYSATQWYSFPLVAS